MPINEKIVALLTTLNENELYDEVKREIDAGTDKLEIIDSLQMGMSKVGDLFASREYFLSELMLSAEIFSNCQSMLGGEDAVEPKYGAFVIGTVYGDIHDIGKNIVASVMRSNGFKVIDLGVDVKPEVYIAAIKEHNPIAVGFSCLLTTAFGAMRDCIQLVRDSGLDSGRILLIGGGPVEQNTLEFVHADGYCETAHDTVKQVIAFTHAS